MRKAAALLSLTASLVAASHDDEYTRFAVLMRALGYTWEPLEVHTEDGYILTTFHVTGNVNSGPFEPTMPPVLINHGDYDDGTGWLTANSSYARQHPFHLQLADAGYDVFIANNRGT